VKTSVRISLLCILAASFSCELFSQQASEVIQTYDSLSIKIIRTALGQNKAIEMLTELCTKIGPRITGSPQAANAVEWSRKKMEELGFQNVRTEPVIVKRWIRGTERGSYKIAGSKTAKKLNLCALGGSVATPQKGITSEIIEVKSWEELTALGENARGKIVFYNRPMDRSLISLGTAYGRAVDQRSRGAIEAAKHGAVAALVRSMTTQIDDVPHTGQMNYVDSIPKIPSAAISTNNANILGSLISEGKKIIVTLKLGCDTLAAVESANVIGEIVGSEKPDEVIVIGAHLDSWDKGQGAHDDGAGCAHVIEALRLIKELDLKPKRTIRVVLFMNEENGLNGGIAYAAKDRPNEKHIAAIESDAGGFSPLGFSVSDTSAYLKLSKYAELFRPINADHIRYGGGGADIYPLMKKGVPGIGLNVDGQKYFDYHHSDNDTIDKVNERELAIGAAAMAVLAYVIAQDGI
jgi:carboxypeptidase Q